MFFSETSDPLQTTLMTMKMSFLRVVCFHEHFLVLNLPFDLPPLNKSTNFSSATTSAGTGSHKAGSSTSLNAVSAAQPQPPPSPSSSSSLSGLSACTDSNSSHLSANYRANHLLLCILFDDLSAVLASNSTFLHKK